MNSYKCADCGSTKLKYNVVQPVLEVWTDEKGNMIYDLIDQDSFEPVECRECGAATFTKREEF